jgi:predicted dehydrogenase
VAVLGRGTSWNHCVSASSVRARIAELAIVGPARATGHRLVAVAARDRGRAQAFAGRFGVERAPASYADVVTDPQVEVVYNPLTNALHGPWNLAAIAVGKHVLTEKPFASNAEVSSGGSARRGW